MANGGGRLTGKRHYELVLGTVKGLGSLRTNLGRKHLCAGPSELKSKGPFTGNRLTVHLRGSEDPLPCRFQSQPREVLALYVSDELCFRNLPRGIDRDLNVHFDLTGNCVPCARRHIGHDLS